MVRKLLKSLLSLSLIAPLSAFAIGLGEARLHSALSERLNADIALLSVSPEEAGSLNVSLASQETFDKVGIERPAVLMFLKFDIEKDMSGNYLIKVTSSEIINEPFLDFLVEVNWKTGRVLREYTLLLDPPTGYREQAPAVSAPTARTTTAPVSTVAPAAVTSVSPAAPAAPVTTVSPAPMAPSGAMPAVPAEGLVYGPVKKDETLWRIAAKMRPNKSVSVQQMMVALVKANPYAFFDGNINRLKAGFVLRIDDPSMLTAMSKAEASREVSRQTRAWQDYRERVAARAKQRSAAATAVKAEPGVSAAAKAEPKLTLVAPEGKGVDAAAPSGVAEGKPAGDVSEELMLALESSAAQRKENEALKNRLESLESQIKGMEQIISLKDADLAALQQQLREQGQAVELPSEKVAAEEVVKPEEKPALVEKPGEEAMPTEMAEPEKAEAMPEEMPVAEEAVAEKPVEKEPVAKPKPKKKPVVAPAPVEQPSFIDTLLKDPMMLGIGGGTLVLVLVLVALIIKRRRKGEFQESILTAGGTSSMMKATTDEQSSETSFLSDLAISGMGPGPIQTDEGEVDPLTEADVFMAYGRNQQAEEVLKKAREASPERADIAAKLLEVYYNTKDNEKFEALAEEAVGSLQEDEEQWNNILAMGYELCPENVLFEAGAEAEPPAAPVVEAPVEAPAEEAVMDIGLDLDELTAEMEGEGGGELDLDLGLDFGEPEEEKAGEAEAAMEEPVAEEAAEAAEEELGALDFEMPEAEAGEEAAAVEESAEEESLDFDLDLGEEEVAAEAEEATAETEEPAMDLELDLGAAEEAAAEGEESALDFDLDLGELTTADEEGPAAEEESGLELDLGELATEEEAGEMDMGLDMDLGDLDLGELEGAAEAEPAAEESAEMDMSLDELGDLDDLGDLESVGDDVGTKLDLAQAYAEMGDAEGARSMLEEVVADGNDEQKAQAQALIDKL